MDIIYKKITTSISVTIRSLVCNKNKAVIKRKHANILFNEHIYRIFQFLFVGYNSSISRFTTRQSLYIWYLSTRCTGLPESIISHASLSEELNLLSDESVYGEESTVYSITNADMLNFAWQVCKGMTYLSSKKVWEILLFWIIVYYNVNFYNVTRLGSYNVFLNQF